MTLSSKLGAFLSIDVLWDLPIYDTKVLEGETEKLLRKKILVAGRRPSITELTPGMFTLGQFITFHCLYMSVAKAIPFSVVIATFSISPPIILPDKNLGFFRSENPHL